ncbi:MAG: lytic transglycosylase domain-containing protein [Acidobacteriota bacterium]|nr:lytic transglycosylase domain-containing protein [Acidobacteriota bacterium]
MGKVCLFFASFILFFAVASASAQTRQRVIDNFDLASGVKIYAPEAPKPVAKTQKKPDAQQSSKTKRVVPIVMTGTSWQQPGARMSFNKSLGSFTTGDPLIDNYIATSSARYNVDPLLIYAQMNQESSFKRRAVSYKGASGLMQLMPATAVRFGVTNIFDPQQNIDAGVKYMRWLLDTFGQDLRLALAGYNAGEGAVMKYGNQIPPYRETRDYVARITARYEQIRNPNFVPSVVKLAKKEAPQVAKNEPPKTIYVPSAMVERLPDGRIRLATQ